MPVTVERPERNAKGQVVTDKKGNPKVDSSFYEILKHPVNNGYARLYETSALPM
jgi:type I restriction enzyme M protein